MARSIAGRVLLKGNLVLSDLLHIGGTFTQAGFDAVGVRDGLARHIIPGTSLLGVIRSYVEHSSDFGFLDHASLSVLFGGTDPESSGAASVRVHDVILENVRPIPVDGVGIDRFSGSAARHIKFDRIALVQDAGASARFLLECDFGSAVSQSDAEALVLHIASAMSSGLLHLGARTSSGFGGFRLTGDRDTDPPSMATEVMNREGILARIRGKSAFLPIADLLPAQETGASLTVQFASRSSTFVKDSQEGKLIDVFPRIIPRAGQAVVVIPGSSVKGVVRKEIERYVRSVTGTLMEEDAPLHEQLRVPVVDQLFGYANSDHSDTLTSSGQKGVLRFHDLIGRVPTASGSFLSWEQWSEVKSVILSPKTADPEADRSKVFGVLSAVGLEEWQPTDHIAIDRWTSGASHSKLFSVLEPRGIRWDPLTISIDRYRVERMGLPSNIGFAAIIFALQQLHSAAIGIGWGTHRGHGSLKIEKIAVTGSEDASMSSPCLIDERTDLFTQLEATRPAFFAANRTAWREVLGT